VRQRSSDPIEELRHADPVGLGWPPSASKARVWARIQEATMEDITQGRRARRRLAFGLVAIASAAVILAVAVRGVTAPNPQPGPGIGSCIETYTISALANRDFAIDGTVAVIDGDAVTFAVNEVFAGDVGEMLALTATGMTGAAVTSAGDTTLTMGERYLVAGDGAYAWGCGFTQPYDVLVAAEWAEALQ
jgi:hypothetical protein